MAHELLELRESPNTRDLYLRAALGALPLPLLSDRSDRLPDRRVEIRGVRVDPDNLAAYTKTCGLRFGDTLPITYPFTLTFPAVMKLVVARDFPFTAVGAVHAENVIEQRRPVSVSEPLDILTHTGNLREHRKGLLVDAVSEVSVGRELVWRQVTTFLHQQKTSLSGEPKPESPPEQVPPPPTRTLRVDQPRSAGTPVYRVTATPFTSPRWAPRLSASRARSRTECGVPPRYSVRWKDGSRNR